MSQTPAGFDGAAVLGQTYACVAVNAHIVQAIIALLAVVTLVAIVAGVTMVALLGLGAVVCGAVIAPDAGQQVGTCLLEPLEETLGDLLAHHRCAATGA